MSIYETAQNMEYKLHDLIYKAEHYEQLDEEQLRLKLLEQFEQFIDELSAKPNDGKSPEPSAEPTVAGGSDATQPAEPVIQPTEAPVAAEAAPENTEAPVAATEVKPEAKKSSGRNNKATA